MLHGIDDTEVSQARAVPRQISIEDSYIRLDTMPELLRELKALAQSLITRMRVDLLANGDDFDEEASDDLLVPAVATERSLVDKKWLAHPKTLRLSTRPRQPLQSDGTRQRTMKRISHSCPLPNFVFTLNESVEVIADKLVRETLVGMFRRLHPSKTWWDLSLVNLAVTNMTEAAGDSKSANGRDISNMFKRQDDVLKDFRVVEQTETHTSPSSVEDDIVDTSTIDKAKSEPAQDGDGWLDDDDAEADMHFCSACGESIPSFAAVAHQRFHFPA